MAEQLRPMTPFHQRSVRLFGNFVREVFPCDQLRVPLQQAHMGLRPEAYLAYVFANVFLTTMGLFFVAAPAVLVLRMLGYGVTFGLALLILLGPFVVGASMFLALWVAPSAKARARAKDIDLKLPYSLNYVAAMASAGVIPSDIFRSLSKQDIYGEVANEALLIYKDIQLHGIDIVSALRRATARSPSQKFKELLSGAITTVTSGGDLTTYFSNKASRHMWENRQDQKNFLEVMGLMAETYVTAAVAGPLFLIVMMSIMTMLSGGGTSTLGLIVYLLLPVINIGFIFGIKSMIPEV